MFSSQGEEAERAVKTEKGADSEKGGKVEGQPSEDRFKEVAVTKSAAAGKSSNVRIET